MTPTPPYKVADEPALKPCPFCGGAAEIINRSVHCNAPYCEAQPFTSGPSKYEAIDAWNKRASPALAPTDEACLPPLPEWCKQDDLGGLVPSEIRQALCNYARDAVALNSVASTDEGIALAFHEAYERLAPSFGYVTREETRAFDANSANGKLMIAVCGEVRALLSRSPKVDADEEQSHG